MGNPTPDVPQEDQKTKLEEAQASLGLGDHRPLTTADLGSIAEYVKQANAPKRSTSSSKAKPKSKSGGSK